MQGGNKICLSNAQEPVRLSLGVLRNLKANIQSVSTLRPGWALQQISAIMKTKMGSYVIEVRATSHPEIWFLSLLCISWVAWSKLHQFLAVFLPTSSFGSKSHWMASISEKKHWIAPPPSVFITKTAMQLVAQFSKWCRIWNFKQCRNVCCSVPWRNMTYIMYIAFERKC